MQYAYKRKIGVSYLEAVGKVKEALQKEGFGVLTEIDVKATLKKKLGVDTDNYIILGACNPPFAYQALQAEKDIGLLLPCNVIVYDGNGTTFVAAILPTNAMSMIENEKLHGIAAQVETKLKRVIDSLPKTILFVCVHNAGRSQMAEALFSQMAQGKAQAISAGTQPADKVNPVVAEAMNELGLDVAANQPRLLTFEMIDHADRMITMGCGAEAADLCPASFIDTEDWALDDPKGKTIEQVRQIRDEIKSRVKRLLDEIAPDRESPHHE